MDRVNRLYIVRHGQVKGHECYRLNGHTDVEITEVGVLQMESLAERLRLAEIKAIYSSDLARALKGARIIARHHDAPLFALHELREMYFGGWEGMPLDDVRERFPEELEKRKADLLNYKIPGGGESVSELSDRVMPCLQEIMADHVGSDILVVAHGVVNRVILCNALGLDPNRMFNLKQDYGCLNIVDYFSDSTLVRLING
jgi:alpha-ribazole phosphatase/probable phosphoglycerate mutase